MTLTGVKVNRIQPNIYRKRKKLGAAFKSYLSPFLTHTNATVTWNKNSWPNSGKKGCC